MIAISMLPECKLLVWRLTGRGQLLFQTKLNVSVPISLCHKFHASFNPRNNQQLAVSGNGKLVFFKWENATDNFSSL
jgi:hypothetical protein